MSRLSLLERLRRDQLNRAEQTQIGALVGLACGFILCVGIEASHADNRPETALTTWQAALFTGLLGMVPGAIAGFLATVPPPHDPETSGDIPIQWHDEDWWAEG